MPNQLNGIYFDMCVNHGIRGAVKILQKAAKSKGFNLKIDGILGPKTLAAIEMLSPDRLRSYRMLEYARIVLRKPSQQKFWFGWYRRAKTI